MFNARCTLLNEPAHQWRKDFGGIGLLHPCAVLRMSATVPGRLIINADDFGRSASINQAVIRAHREGILTTASLMVNEPAFDDAVTLAKEHPRLGVGLHLTLLCGHAVLPRKD